MRRWPKAAILAVALSLLVDAAAFAALRPSEILDDPALEARAREISAELRCMVCQNQSIDDSDAELARDLRGLVRDRLLAGDSNEEVIDYVVSRYGEFVLLRPRFNARNALLWSAPVLILLIGGGFLLAAGRRRASRNTPAALTPGEEREIRELMDREQG